MLVHWSYTDVNLLFGITLLLVCIAVSKGYERFAAWRNYGNRRITAASIYYILTSIPIVKNIVKKELSKAAKQFGQSIPKTGMKSTKTLPAEGWKTSQIVKRLEAIEEFEGKILKGGKFSGSVFTQDEDIIKLNQDASNMLLHADMTQPQYHMFAKRLENEIVAMKLDLFKGNSNCCGITTLGGSESLELAVLAYARYYRRKKGIARPEVVVSETMHAAVYKACEFFDVRCRVAKVTNHFKVDLRSMESLINHNTVCIFSSTPNYPFGYCDPLKPMAKLALKYDIGLHMDACMGGFLVPFVKENGYTLDEDEYNFTVKGVTSISSDPHKYGLTCKGISVLMFGDHEILKSLYFSNVDQSVYVNPGIVDCRSAGVVAACWATMMHYGKDGYAKLAKDTMQATCKLADRIRTIKGLAIVGEPIVR